ncbi:unnamed protein product [Didymodactylos carnosus]|nr:unnamed protein product [Didymodactylos carnosus]CAF4471309.1 unnamed protein product [Didymodactylos carnosus]
MHKVISDEQRKQLNISSDETVCYRHVYIKCGQLILSMADNWYVPSRLTDEMNNLLNTTNIPFGKIVAPLRFRRHTLTSQLLWEPLTDDWEMKSFASLHTMYDGNKCLIFPYKILEHKAILYTDDIPFSLVTETYTRELFDLPDKRLNSKEAWVHD